MIRFFKWSDTGYQVVLEGTSFYFSSKLPVAFRKKGDPRIFVRNEIFAGDTRSLLNDLALTAGIVKIPVAEFKQKIKKAYNRAIFEGVRRITLERMNLTGKEKQKNVPDQEGHAGHTKY